MGGRGQLTTQLTHQTTNWTTDLGWLNQHLITSHHQQQHLSSVQYIIILIFVSQKNVETRQSMLENRDMMGMVRMKAQVWWRGKMMDLMM